GGLLGRAASTLEQTATGGQRGVGGKQHDPEASVESLLERLSLDSVSMDDKKSAIQQLSSLGKNAYQQVGSKIPIITKLMDQVRGEDIELIREAIELITSIIRCTPKDDNIIQMHNTELFINDKKNFMVICDLLSLSDYYVRYLVATLIRTLLTNRFESVQETILACPMSMTNIMGLLSDGREIIRNEALLVLTELTKSNQEIQKIVAFEGAFDVLLEIIRKEGQSEGGIIVNDCIIVLLNLLKGNVSNQNFFREMGCIPKISPLLQVQNTDMWILSDNKFAIIMSTLDLVLSLVERNNLSTPPNQHLISQCNMMNLIIRLGLGKMSSQIVRSKALYTLGEIIHQHTENIAEFSSVSIKSELTGQSQSALLRLAMVIINSKDLIEKQASTHVFRCYLSSNEEAQMGLASTITPPMHSPAPAGSVNSAAQDEELSIGQHLVRAMFSWDGPNAARFDIASFWYSCIVLSATLKDSTHTKDQLLGACVEMPKTASEPPLTLFNKLMSSLLSTKKTETDPMIKIGLLKLLALWLDQSPKAVKEFFSNGSHLSLIVESILQPTTAATAAMQVHVQGLYTLILGLLVHNLDESSVAERNNLNSIISHRIGLNSFKDRLDHLRKSDSFTHAEQGEEPFSTALDKITIQLYDFDFTLFFKDVYDKIRHLGSSHKPRPGTRPSSAQQQTHPTKKIEEMELLHKQQQQQQQQQHQQQLQQDQHIGTPVNQSPPLTHQETPQPIPIQPLQPPQQQPSQDSQLVIQLQQLLEDKEKENNIISEAMTKLEDLVVDKDDAIDDLKAQIESLKVQLANPSSAPSQPSANNNSLTDSQSVDVFELMRLRQESQEHSATMEQHEQQLKQHEQQLKQKDTTINSLRMELQNTIQQKDAALKSAAAATAAKNEATVSPPGNSLMLAKVQSELAELKTKYAALQKDQEEMLDWASKLEVENSNLKAKLES
ncbi:hypothetical protein SAMD00019534_123280, partial [Acytostelium subglobosum LB1]|uniref:hypothetical protein n=1 Tax=Acytostelium subglobosum LB1 TaxID=1410327 RepID=UPI000644A067